MITLYRNSELTDVMSSGDEGEVVNLVRFYYSSGGYYEYTDPDTEEKVRFYANLGSGDIVYGSKQATPAALDATTGGIGRVYFSEHSRMWYRLEDLGNHRWHLRIGNSETNIIPGQQYWRDLFTWSSINDYIFDETRENVVPEGFIFHRGYIRIADSGSAEYGKDKEAIFLSFRWRDVTNPSTTYTDLHYIATANVFYPVRDVPGYKPTKNVRKGGNGSGTLPRGTIPQLGAVSLNRMLLSLCQGYGDGLTWYKLEGDALSQVTKWLYPHVPFDSNRTAARREAFVSLVCIPVNVPTVGNSHNCVYLADKTVDMEGTAVANFPKELILQFPFGRFDLKTYLQNSFVDVVYTEYSLYLPGYGIVDIDSTACCQGYIRIEAALDVRNGNILYRVITNADGDSDEVIWGHYSGNIGCKVPVSGSSSMSDALGIVSNIGQGLTQGVMGAGYISMGDASRGAAAISQGIGGIASALYNATVQVPHVDKANLLDVNIAGCATVAPRLIVTQNRVNIPDGYTELIGVPSTGCADGDGNPIDTILDNVQGFVKVEKICLDDFSDNMTKGELEELRSLLKGGVWV